MNSEELQRKTSINIQEKANLIWSIPINWWAYTSLEDVKTWRNIESHEMFVEEVDLAIRKATAMYLFVVTKNLEKL